MTAKSWPVLKGDTPSEIYNWVQEVTRSREEDIGDFDQLPELYMRGRKVGKIPTNADDVTDEDQPADFNYDANYYYLLVETAPNTVKWARWSISTTNPWPPGPSDIYAEDVIYDNTTSGLTADNVQDAIDEIVPMIPSDADEINYDNSVSGLTATNVQDAIDEVKSIAATAGVVCYHTQYTSVVDKTEGGSPAFSDTGLSLTFPVPSSTHRALITVNLHIAVNNRMFIAVTDSSNNLLVTPTSVGSRIPANIGLDPGQRATSTAFTFLWTPGSSGNHTVKIRWRGNASGTEMYINRANTDSNTTSFGRYTSSISAIIINPE